MLNIPRIAAALSLALLLGACASTRPVLYPNATLNQSGPAAGRAAVEDCKAKADAANVDRAAGGGVARDTGVGAAVGAATGAAVGAVFGNAGRGAAAGAAGGGTQGFMRGLFRSAEPSPVYRAFVERCLRDAGYEVIGWQ